MSRYHLQYAMEYFGGALSPLEPLQHEIAHTYFGCSIVNKTYRDTWLDEAITMWVYNYSAIGDRSNQTIYPIPSNYTSNIVSGRSPVAVGFDRRAYNEGVQIMQTVAQELGGRKNMVAFLRYLKENYSFSPFTTMDFLDYLKEYSGIDMKHRFLKWLYSEEHFLEPSQLAGEVGIKRQILIPPESILRKYSNKRGYHEK